MRLKPEIEELLERKSAEDIDDEEFDDEIGKFTNPSGDGFWYDLTAGGYFSPEDVLADKADIKKVKDALKVIQELENIYDTLSPEY